MRGKGLVLSKRSESNGFTLIELLVVVAIISGMMGVLIPQITSFQKAQTLQNTAANLASNIKAARNRALSGVKCSETTSASSWSLKFNDASYQLETTCSDVGPSPTPSPLAIYNLPSDIRISGFIKDDNVVSLCGAGSQFRISFKNISGAINFKDQVSCLLENAQKVTVVLIQNLDPSKTVKVSIDKGGSINVSKD